MSTERETLQEMRDKLAATLKAIDERIEQASDAPNYGLEDLGGGYIFPRATVIFYDSIADLGDWAVSTKQDMEYDPTPFAETIAGESVN